MDVLRLSRLNISLSRYGYVINILKGGKNGSDVMKIKDLKVGMGQISLEAKVIVAKDIREINKYGRKLTVGYFDLREIAESNSLDEDSSITLVLWNDQLKEVKAGCNVRISNAYVNEWQGERQLTLGKFGTIQVIK